MLPSDSREGEPLGAVRAGLALPGSDIIAGSVPTGVSLRRIDVTCWKPVAYLLFDSGMEN